MTHLAMDAARRAREARNAELSDETDRRYRRRLLRLWLAWIGWYLLGTFVLLGSFGVEGDAKGNLLFWLGLSIGNVGAFLTVVLFLVSATRQGDL